MSDISEASLELVTRGRPVRQRGSVHRLARIALAAWLRMRRVGVAIGGRFVQRQLEEAQARMLSRVDPRTLRDIGVSSDSGHPLAARVDALRRWERLQVLAAVYR